MGHTDAIAQRRGAAPALPPTLVAGIERAVWLSPDGEAETLTPGAAGARWRATRPLVCHARATARRCGIGDADAFDILELFAFVRPARFCLPTPRGVAAALGLARPATLEAEASVLVAAVERLSAALAMPMRAERSDPVGIAWALGRAGWPWAPLVLNALGAPHGPSAGRARAAFAVWQAVPEIDAEAPEPPPGNQPVEADDARRRLAELVQRLDGDGDGDGDGPADPGAAAPSTAEPRPQQSDYASAVSRAFLPRPAPEAPLVVLAEAGTGVGKTLGYLAPASLWAERNRGPVWISTYTRNLQHQIDRELDRVYPQHDTKARKVVVRKGRENYLCLLNYEEAARQPSLFPRQTWALGLIARWIAATRDGDLQGGDFPGWLVELFGPADTLGLADRRGECIYSACQHYNRCFIERSVRRAKRADIVIANHALVMIQVAIGPEDGQLPTRYVFDEGHHVFDAADKAFAGHLTGRETAELRRWLIGAESGAGSGGGAGGPGFGGGRSRGRGLARRLEELVADNGDGDGDGAAALRQVLTAARALPADGWAARVAAAQPQGPVEAFLVQVARHVRARARDADGRFTAETEIADPIDGVMDAARTLAQALTRLARPLDALATALADRLDDEAAELDQDQRRRIDGLARGLRRRALQSVADWLAMLSALETETPPGFVDWFAIERQDGREVDIGFFRHHVDPTRPFATAVVAQAHGMVVTSATLTDGTGDAAHDWGVAEARTGACHLSHPADRASVTSPFDYAAQTRVILVGDVARDDIDQVAAAYRSLFLAAGGGALGLFTAIGRLRAVHQRIAGPLEAAGLPVLAQHVDGLGLATLIDIFRAEESSCLLGTDAVRDGVDVPGRSLRLIVFERVPWPKPGILHRARREAYGGRGLDDTIARLRLKQAFGRLIRRGDDQGVFVLLDPRIPSRLIGAFPQAVTPLRLGLAEAVAATRAFLFPETAPSSGGAASGRCEPD